MDSTQVAVKKQIVEKKMEAPKVEIPVEKPKEKKKEPKNWFIRISLKDQTLFIKRLATLIKSGIPLLGGLNMLRKQTKNKSMIKILDRVIQDVENGQYLATALSRFRKVFGELTINIIEIGEISGTLAENLEHLSRELKKKQELRRKVIGASVYPVFIILATFGITALLTVFVFPKILPIFRSVDFELPWTTKVLIFISSLLLNYGWLIFIGLIVAAILFSFAMKNLKFRYQFDRMLINIPIMGQIAQGYNLSNICRTAGLLMKSGVGIVRVAHITANTTTNLYYKKQLNEVAERLTKGETIASYLDSNPKYFPAIMSQMVSVGESTGNLSESFLFLGTMYEEDVDDLTKNLSTVIEPLLLVFMGILVGFVAISIITPIYGITQHLKP